MMASYDVVVIDSDDDDDSVASVQGPGSVARAASTLKKTAASPEENSDDSADTSDDDDDIEADGTITAVRGAPAAEGKPVVVKLVWKIDGWTELRTDRQDQDGDNNFECESHWIDNADAGLRGHGEWKFRIAGDAHEHVMDEDKAWWRHKYGDGDYEDDPDFDEGELRVWFRYTGKSDALWTSLRVVLRYGKAGMEFPPMVHVVKSGQDYGCGWHKLGTIDAYPDQFWRAATLTMEVTPVLVEHKSISQLDADAHLGRFFREAYLSASPTDTVLVAADDKEIKVHRCILLKCSEVFRAMFTHDTVEKKTGVCKITDVDYRTLKAFVEVLYGIESVEEVAEICEDLYLVANKYQVTDMERRCLEVLEESVTVHDAVERFIYAKENELKDLAEKVAGFVKENYYGFVAAGGPAKITEDAKNHPDGYFAPLLKKDKKKRKADEAGLEERK